MLTAGDLAAVGEDAALLVVVAVDVGTAVWPPLLPPRPLMPDAFPAPSSVVFIDSAVEGSGGDEDDTVAIGINVAFTVESDRNISTGNASWDFARSAAVFTSTLLDK
jgi:hypothetical protein